MAGESVINFDDAYGRIRKAAVRSALMFNNAEIRRNAIEGTDRALRRVGFALRDALIYRFDAILHHAGQIADHHTKTQESVDVLIMRDSYPTLRQFTLRQRFLFDDVVFNSASFFDYIGRFAGFLLQADRSLKLRWDRAYKWAKHKEAGGKNRPNAIYGTRVGDAIVFADEDWVRRLYSYRSRVIHYESEKLDGQVQVKWTRTDEDTGAGKSTVDVSAYVPGSFLRELKLADGDTRVRVIDATGILLEKVMDTGHDLLVKLADDLADRVPEVPAGTVLNEPTADGV